MKFLETIINRKLNNIQRDELLSLARQYGISLNPAEAESICRELRGKNYDLFNPEQRKGIVRRLENIVGKQRASQIEQLFLSLTGR